MEHKSARCLHSPPVLPLTRFRRKRNRIGMGLAARGIALLVKQLAGHLPGVVRTVGDVALLVAKMRSSQRDGDPRLVRLEKAMELQASLNDKLTSQLEVIQAVLERLRKSLRLLWLAVIAASILAVIAIVLVLMKT